MRIKLKEKADREWVTTTKGNIIKKHEWVEFDENDRELDNFMSMGLFVIEGSGEEDTKINDELIKVKEINKKLKEEVSFLKEEITKFRKIIQEKDKKVVEEKIPDKKDENSSVKEDEKVYQGINDDKKS